MVTVHIPERKQFKGPAISSGCRHSGYRTARYDRRGSPADCGVIRFYGALIALTGYGQEHDKKMARDAGFYKHLTKPVSFTNNEAVLRKVAHLKVNNLGQ